MKMVTVGGCLAIFTMAVILTLVGLLMTVKGIDPIWSVSGCGIVFVFFTWKLTREGKKK